MAQRKKFKIQQRVNRGIFGDKWLVKLERKAFGWVFYGTEVDDDVSLETTVSGNTATTREKHNYTTWLYFRRTAPYSSNILFNLLEMLNRVLSWFRRIAAYLVIPACLILGGLGLFMGGDGTELLNAVGYIAGAYVGGFVGGALLTAGLGFLVRKIFNVDENLRKELRMNGYDDDLEDLDFADER